MDSDTPAEDAVETLRTGADPDRRALIDALDDGTLALPRPRFRALLLETLRQDLADVRTDDWDLRRPGRWWLLSGLARVIDNDPAAAAYARERLLPEKEPDEWARYFTLEGLLNSGAGGAQDLALAALGDTSPRVRALATAHLARTDETKLAEVRRTLGLPPDGKPGGLDKRAYADMMRALRSIGLRPVIVQLCERLRETRGDEVVERSHYFAVEAVARAERGTPAAEQAAQALVHVAQLAREREYRHAVRTHALENLGRLKAASASALLVEEAADDNPNVQRAAARALERALGTRRATIRLVEAASLRKRRAGYADALRWMRGRESVVETLEEQMTSGPPEQQAAAGELLTEMGGAAAFQKLRARTDVADRYHDAMKAGDEKLRAVFEQVVGRARRGFSVIVAMDVAVFLVGVVLVLVSAAQAIVTGSFDVWAGATGVAGMLTGRFLGRPRAGVVDAVDHLMKLNVVFLGYLRQLQHVDQAYTRRTLEDDPLSAEELKSFAVLVEAAMSRAHARMGESKGKSPFRLGSASEAVTDA